MNKLVKLKDLTPPQINLAVAMVRNHEWRCPWLLEKEGYQAWINYEDAWGKPHADYCNNWNVTSQIMQEFGIFPSITDIERHDDGKITFGKKFNARTPQQILDCEDGQQADHPLVAVLLCYLEWQVGRVISVPEGVP